MNHPVKRIWWALTALLGIAVTGWGQELSNREGVSQEQPPGPERAIVPPPRFNFSSMGARASGLGGAFVGLADDGTAAWFNPAGLAQLFFKQMSLDGRRFGRVKSKLDPETGKMKESYTYDTDLQFLNLNLPITQLEGTVGLNFATITNARGTLETTVGAQISAAQTYDTLTLSAARRIERWTKYHPGEALYVGASVHYVTHELRILSQKDQKRNLGLTLGALYKWVPDKYGAPQFQVGLAYRSRVALGRSVEFSEDRDQAYTVFSLPAVLTLGLAVYPAVALRPPPEQKEVLSEQKEVPLQLPAPAAPASLSLSFSSDAKVPRLMVTATDHCYVQVYQGYNTDQFAPLYGQVRGFFFPLSVLESWPEVPSSDWVKPLECQAGQTTGSCPVRPNPPPSESNRPADIPLLLVVSKENIQEQEFAQRRDRFLGGDRSPEEGWWIMEYRLRAVEGVQPSYNLQPIQEAKEEKGELRPVRFRQDLVFTFDLEAVFGKTLGSSARNVVNPHLGVERHYQRSGKDFYIRAGAFRLYDSAPRKVFGYDKLRPLAHQDFYSLGVGAGLANNTWFNIAYEHSSSGFAEWSLGTKYQW